MYSTWPYGQHATWVALKKAFMEDKNQTSAAKRPQWIAILVGRLAERICRSAKDPCPIENCRLKYFCQCAQEEARSAKTLEITLVGSMAACGVGLVVYWALVR
jgi:hypothetical protein